MEGQKRPDQRVLTGSIEAEVLLALTGNSNNGVKKFCNFHTPTIANMKNSFFLFVSLLITGIVQAQIPSVMIGQNWMQKNLDISTYRNGDPIPEVEDFNTWSKLTTGAWCYYNNDTAMGKIYGKLYNWYAVNDPRGLAPVGWHIPSDAEWTTLQTLLGGELVAGGKMKETGTVRWTAPNTGASNNSGFTGMPGGNLSGEVGNFGYWWSATEVDSVVARGCNLNYQDGFFILSTFNKRSGFSVRCLRD